MLDKIFSAANGWVALAAFAVIVVSSIALKYTNPKNKIQDALRDDYVATDSTFWYDLGKVQEMLKRYQLEPEHFDSHRRFIKVHDFVYPLLYAIPSVFLLAYFLPVGSGALRWLVLLPLATMVFDYAENFTMLAYLNSYKRDPSTPLTLLKLSRVLTVAKLCMIYASLLVLAVGVVWKLIGLRR